MENWYFISDITAHGNGWKLDLNAIDYKNHRRASDIYHSNSALELHFLISGTATVTLGLEKHQITGGTLYITPPGVVHDFHSDSEHGCEEISLNLTISLDGQQGDELTELLALVASQPTVILPFDLSWADRLRELFREYREKLPAYRERITHGLIMLLIDLGRSLDDRKPTERKKSAKNVQRIIDSYVNTHLADFDMKELARLIYISPRQLQRLILAHYGCSAGEALMKKRMEVACLLLRYSDSSVAEIAEQVGFHSAKYFSTCFRMHFNMTPSEFRRGKNC